MGSLSRCLFLVSCLAASCSIARAQLGPYQQLAYITTDGQIHELYSYEFGPWSDGNLTALAGAPPSDGRGLVAYTWNEYKQLAYVTPDAQIHELFASSKQPGWHEANLTALAGAPPSDGRGLVAYTWNEYKQLAYLRRSKTVLNLTSRASARRGD